MSGESPSATDLFDFGVAMADGDVTPRPATTFPLGTEDDGMMILFDEDASYFGFGDFETGPPGLGGVSALLPGLGAQDGGGSGGGGAGGRATNGTAVVEEGPGAGPQPTTEVEQQGAGGGGSVMAEFTRRKNWPAKIVEELRDLLLVVEPNGRIRYASSRLPELLGYSHAEAIGLSLTELVHVDDRFVFVSELNACIANATMLRLYYRLKRRDGTYAVVETVGHAHIAESRFAPNPANQSAFCQAIFLLSRLYPTKNASLLDSFLEHKMENERLRRRIDDIRHEEASESRDDDVSRAQSLANLWHQSVDARSDVLASDDAMSMPPPAHPARGSLNGLNGLNSLSSLTRENLEGIAARQPDSLRDKMERYKGMPVSGAGLADTTRPAGPMGTATHADTIEMLTGLRFQEGERSKGLSTGNRSPRLVRGDVGIAFSLNREQRAGEKKKKIRLVEEYVCTDCGTLESPEWRKGPNGPKTLCNACGLRWAKKEKKEKSREQAGETD